MIFIIVDPYFMPLAAVELPVWVDDQFASCSCAKGEIKCQLIVAGQRNHKRWIIGADGWLKEQNGLFACRPERERYVTLSPSRHLNVGLRGSERNHIFLGICRNENEDGRMRKRVIWIGCKNWKLLLNFDPEIYVRADRMRTAIDVYWKARSVPKKDDVKAKFQDTRRRT